MWFRGDQGIDGRCQTVGVVKMLLVEREVRGVREFPGLLDQGRVQSVSEVVGPLGTLTILAILLAQLFDIGPRERVRLVVFGAVTGKVRLVGGVCLVGILVRDTWDTRDSGVTNW